jgi:outer membrane protein assembly factor BamB
MSPSAVVGSVVYVGSDHNNLYALDGNTGSLIWKYTVGGEVDGSPALANGVVYFNAYDGNAYALNASTGAPSVEQCDSNTDSVTGGCQRVLYLGSSDQHV